MGSQLLTSVLLVFYIIVGSSSWLDKSVLGCGVLTFFQHFTWQFICIVIIAVQISIVVLRITLYGVLSAEALQKVIVNVTGIGFGLSLVIILLNEIIKYFIRLNRNAEQKFLQLLFSTRLGTWSPK